MSIRTEIIPTDYVLPARIINSIFIEVMNIKLFTNVSVMVSLFDINENIIDNKYFVIEGEEYTNWASDDNYLVELVLNKLNLNKLHL